MTASLESKLSDRVATIGDVRAHQYSFSPHKFLVLHNFMPREFVQTYLLPEVEKCEPWVHRVNVSTFKKSGSVSSQRIKEHAPHLYAMYHSNTLKNFFEAIIGETLHPCPEQDPHAVALYHYTEPGDHIGVHYDKSFYRGRRYTVLFGLIQDSVASKLVCYPGASKANRRKNPLEIMTHPGTLVIFEGNSLWHEVTPLAANEKRVILTMEYVTDQRMSTVSRWVSHLKDRWLYFGKNK